MNNKLQEVIDFLELEEGYDKQELIADILCEIPSLKGLSPDEIGIEWDGETLTTLDDFANEFYALVIVKVCNAIKSFTA